MARILFEPGPPARPGRQKAFLATPCYAAPAPDYALALFRSAAALAAAGIDAALEIYAGHCHVDDARNRLVKDFLETDCTDLVFLDADVGWAAADLARLLGYARDVVGGVYPLKNDEEAYPVELLRPDAVRTEADGLIEAEWLPTGFLRLRRAVLEAFDAAAPHFADKDHEAGRRLTPVIFEREMAGAVRFSGDYGFSRKWRAMGGQLWLDPECAFAHAGEKVWRGAYLTWVTRKNGTALAHGLAAIGAGAQTLETYAALVAAWNNPWSIPVEELATLVGLVLATEGPILECGSGLSTLVMGSAAAPGRELWALEDDAAWLARLNNEARRCRVTGLRLCYAPLRSYGAGAAAVDWYTLPEGLPERFGLIFCDGPLRKTRGERVGILAAGVLERLAPGGALIMDDAEPDAAAAALRSEIEARTGGRFHIVNAGGGRRPFAVLRRPAALAVTECDIPGIGEGQPGWAAALTMHARTGKGPVRLFKAG